MFHGQFVEVHTAHIFGPHLPTTGINERNLLMLVNLPTSIEATINTSDRGLF